MYTRAERVTGSLALAMILAMGTACSLFVNDATSPTEPARTDTFSGALNQNGAATFTFTVVKAGSAVAGTTPQITLTEAVGTYCVKVYDVGNLTVTSTVTITVAHS